MSIAREDAAYAAGVIDAEGCIGVYKNRGRSARYFCAIAVYLTQTVERSPKA